MITHYILDNRAAQPEAHLNNINGHHAIGQAKANIVENVKKEAPFRVVQVQGPHG